MPVAMQMIKKLVMNLKQLQIVYGYMILNAPTEEARRFIELNLMTVNHCLEKLTALYYEMAGEAMPPNFTEVIEEVPIFINFVDAARYAFKVELHVIHLLNGLYMDVDECYRSSVQHCMVEHELNAMRLLYLIG